MKKSLIVRIVIGIAYGLFGYMVANNQLNIANSQLISKVAFIASYLILGYATILKAFEKILHLEIFDESFLIVASTIGLIILKGFTEAVFVLLIVAICECVRECGIYFIKENVKKTKIAKLNEDSLDNALIENMPEYIEYGKITNIDDESDNSAEKNTEKVAMTVSVFICFLAVFIAFIPPLLFQTNHREWIYKALIFLFTGAMASMMTATTIGLYAGISANFKHGILIKNKKYIYFLSKIKKAVFDKTAIITTGNYEVQKIVPIDISEEELIRIVAHAELRCNHVLSKPLQDGYKGKYDDSKVKEYEEIPGKGIKANIFLDDVLIGSDKLLTENNIRFKETKDKGTIVYVAVSGEYKGYFVLADKIRDDSKKCIEEMVKEKVKDFYLISGDNRDTVVDIATKMGISECYSELLPSDKVNTLNDIMQKKNKNEKVLFAGIGNNNKECFEKADVGVSLKMDNNNLDKETDCYILSNKVSKIADAIKISRKANGIIKECIYSIIMVKIAILVLAGLGYASMWMAAAIELALLLIVVMHSMKVLNY